MVINSVTKSDNVRPVLVGKVVKVPVVVDTKVVDV
jgi:hypothetical protein